MQPRHLLLAPLLLAGCSHSTPTATTAPIAPNDHYTLIWSDEFNKEGPLNPADWTFEQGFVRNRELQWYQPDNATCKDGLLLIEARREHRPNPNYNPAGRPNDWRNRPLIEYTSASVNTANKHTFKYGRFEIRARIDTHPGSWPAFWTLGSSGPWPACGEVDVMEYYDNTLLANIAWAGANPTGDAGSSWNTGTTSLSSFPPDWSSKFHTWRMDWDEFAIKLYCDDRLLNSQDLTQTTNSPRAAQRGAPENPFHQPHYLLLNQAIGGQRGGDPSKTPFPIRYEVDYVRVYQKQPR